MEKFITNPGDPSMDFPLHFRCPISMELMKDPVTISTGVSYERRNIEKWFHVYKRRTCPATMQSIQTLEMTPNHTLRRLIDAWLDSRADHHKPSSSSSAELEMILGTLDSTPFKVSSLRKLRSVLETGDDDDDVKEDFKKSGGVELLVRIIMLQISVENHDFMSTFSACEEALLVLHQVPFSADDQEILQLLMRPDCLKSMAIMLQRGSSEARFCAISMFQKMAKADSHRWKSVAQDHGIDFFKSLMETVSDDQMCAKASSSALNLLTETLESSKKSRLKAVEAGAICMLIELLPESSNRSRCEKIMQLIKMLCECADGRLAFIEHGLGIAAVSKKMLNVSNAATKIGVKILWLVSSFHPTERVLEEMLVYGAVQKLMALLNVGSGGGGGEQGTTRDRVVRILKLHGGTWRRFPCFPGELKNYLGLGNDSC
ncbi:E3 ubiquitin-protein ligase PUB22 [Sesamum alatum]|uniref:U-box domain-containing protein n=1 Tax=Sesamum alatum TaxID=300844 RepID=A0AAE1XQD1_9LAMI|nr:E3 ubiquitin-protein ligase PUB22 [Sesamum alatum]